VPWKSVSNNGRNCDTLVLLCHRKSPLSGRYEWATERTGRTRVNSRTPMVGPVFFKADSGDMEANPLDDKTAAALSEQRFKMLEDIARELASDVSFPTSFDLAIHLRNVLRKPDVSLKEVARVVCVEPLVSAKLLRLANSVTRNPYGQVVVAVENAIVRLGLEATRSTAFAVAIEQLMGSRNLVVFRDLFFQSVGTHRAHSRCRTRGGQAADQGQRG
jgi:HDOD domain